MVYLRVSTEEQAREGVSLAAQEARVRAYCGLAELEIAALLVEEGVSGAKPLATRPKGSELVRLVERHHVMHVVSLKLDRLFRDAGDCLNQTHGWDRAGVALHLVDLGGQTINTATAMGRMFLTMTAAFAELERNMIAERTAFAMRHKRRQLEVYSPTPFGYDRLGDRLEPREDELSTVARIQVLRGSGASWTEIAVALENEGRETKHGGRWHANTVRRICLNELHAPADEPARQERSA